jgi:hypothetical protein
MSRITVDSLMLASRIMVRMRLDRAHSEKE